jgi:hypothetical protein
MPDNSPHPAAIRAWADSFLMEMRKIKGGIGERLGRFLRAPSHFWDDLVL